MPYWISSMLAATPAVAWVFFGLGLPWALALLPRKDWHDRVLLIALAFAFGPMLLTAWMFVLGTVVITPMPQLRLDVILAGTVVLAAIAVLAVWRKTRRESAPSPNGVPMGVCNESGSQHSDHPPRPGFVAMEPGWQPYHCQARW